MEVRRLGQPCSIGGTDGPAFTSLNHSCYRGRGFGNPGRRDTKCHPRSQTFVRDSSPSSSLLLDSSRLASMLYVHSLFLELVSLTVVLATVLPHGPYVRAAGLSSGCGSAPTITSGVKSISVNGKTRQFTIRVPQSYQNSKGYKVIYGLHWVGGTMDQVAGGGTAGLPWAYFGLQVKANETAILVAPQGIGNGWANSGGQGI